MTTTGTLENLLNEHDVARIAGLSEDISAWLESRPSSGGPAEAL